MATSVATSVATSGVKQSMKSGTLSADVFMQRYTKMALVIAFVHHHHVPEGLGVFPVP